MNLFPFILFFILTFSSCTFRDNPTPVPEEKPFNKIYISFKNFKPLTNGSVYTAWVQLNNKISIAGKFYLDTTGNVFKDSTSIGFVSNALFALSQDVGNAERFFITLENNNDKDTIPSSLIVVSGNFINKSATCLALTPNAINLNFNFDSSKYVLGTQTTIPSDTLPYGVWFAARIDTNHKNFNSSLNLPVLSSASDWIYEGWLRHKTQPADEWYSMGRFTNGNVADSSKIPPMAPNQVPKSYPGEDFIYYNDTLPVNNGDFSVLVTLEPVNFKSSIPFFLKLFESDIPYLEFYKDTSLILNSLKPE